jgi:hypothetical protein
LFATAETLVSAIRLNAEPFEIDACCYALIAELSPLIEGIQRVLRKQ